MKVYHLKYQNFKRAAFIIIVAIFAAYSNALLNDFTGDAKELFVFNSFYKEASNISSIFSKDFVMTPNMLTGAFSLEKTSFSGFLSYRPVTAIFFFTDYLIWKDNPFGHHLTNIFLHILTALAVFCLAKGLTVSDNAALFAGLLFAVHPIHSEVVSSIGYRSDLLTTFFYLSSLICFIKYASRSKGGGWLAGSYAAFFLALFSKEMALTLPFIIVAHDLIFAEPKGIKKLLIKRKYIYTGYLTIMAFFGVIYFFVMQNAFYFSGENGLPLMERVLLMATVFPKRK